MCSLNLVICQLVNKSTCQHLYMSACQGWRITPPPPVKLSALTSTESGMIWFIYQIYQIILFLTHIWSATNVDFNIGLFISTQFPPIQFSSRLKKLKTEETKVSHRNFSKHLTRLKSINRVFVIQSAGFQMLGWVVINVSFQWLLQSQKSGVGVGRNKVF